MSDEISFRILLILKGIRTVLWEFIELVIAKDLVYCVLYWDDPVRSMRIIKK